MPALETPEGDILTEFGAILITLSERHKDAGLMPRRSKVKRAAAIRWIVYVAGEIYPLIEILDYPRRFVESEPERKVIRDRARERIRRRWLAVEDAIAGTVQSGREQAQIRLMCP